MSKFKREFKNVVYNYTDAEAKVREATSNDPWGPSSALMSELAEYTYHVQAYGLVMGMLWKRLNDHGRNWRHVYKSLVVLDYVIKSGSDRVTLQCKENLFSIQTLKDFQYVDKEGKDQGANVREKAKAIVALLKDDDRLKEERKRALQARQRQTGLSSEQSETQRSPKNRNKVQFADGSKTTDGTDDATASPRHRVEQDVEQARPGDLTEEELQLKLALQLSKQQADDDEKLKTQEDESLKAAIEMSKIDVGSGAVEDEEPPPDEQPNNGDNLLLDFSATGLTDPWMQAPSEPPPSYDTLVDPFASTTSDPFASTTPSASGAFAAPVSNAGLTGFADPFGFQSTTVGPSTTGQYSGVGTSSSSALSVGPSTSGQASLSLGPSSSSIPPQQIINSGDLWLNSASSLPPLGGPAPPPTESMNPFDLSTFGTNLPPPTNNNAPSSKSRIEDEFLGADLGNLVDLDSLAIPPPILNTPNPFGTGTGTGGGTQTANPFESNKPMAPSLNQIAVTSNPGFTAPELLPPPLIPASGGSPLGGSPILPRQQPPTSSNQAFNPFS